MVRRKQFDPLDNPRNEPRWYVVESMHGSLLEVRPLPAETDLRRTFIAAMLEWTDAGWKIAEFSSRTGVLFAQRDVERRQIEITPADYGRARAVGAGMK